jgi:CDP-glycerol glycerophosphotransferase
VNRARRAARQLRQAVRYEQVRVARRAPIDDHMVVYESFAGNGMLCNPEAIFRALLAAPDLQHLRHVWSLASVAPNSPSVVEFAGDPRVEFVVRGSRPYYRALSRAKYVVNNATFPELFGKRSGQIYLNTWHGTPVKAMGYDVPRGAVQTRNVVRNLLAADYLLAPNADTELMYLNGYRMANLFTGRMIRVGTPRIDRQFVDAHRRAQIRARLIDLGISFGGSQELILFAPTWRGDFYSPELDVETLRDVVAAMNAGIDRTRYRVLLKVHQRVYAQARADFLLRDSLVPNEIPTNDLLAVTDALVTDYSSIFVDFLATGRPVLFYAPDLDDYAASRGLYSAPTDWPGPVCRTVDELLTQLSNLERGSKDDPIVAYAYAAAKKRYCPREDGGATARVLDIVFRGANAENDQGDQFVDARTPILLHLGGLRRNGITAAALSLLDNIDHDRFDVSVSFPHETHPDQAAMVEMIHSRVRLFPQSGDVIGGRIRVKLLAAVNGRPGSRHALVRHGNDVMRDEWTRAFGASRFEHVIDFSGYVPYWIKLLANRTAGSLSIWLHNDVQAELSNRDRSRRVRTGLTGACALYRAADQLVSVSEALNEVNRKTLATSAPGVRFTFAPNTINADRIRRLAQEPSPFPRDSSKTFVTAGRLSPEKNHERLIRAFASVHAGDLDSRLVILGSGPLHQQLSALIDELSLNGAVTLAGHQSNPYAVMSRSGCFVLSSDYEGQPMALLESLVLGLPIVTTDFDTVRGVMPDDGGLVVARQVPALADGMRAFLRGDVAPARFAPDLYNHSAIRQFYRAIGAVAE